MSKDKIPVYSKASYGAGAFVLQMGNQSVQYLANLIFNIELGLSLGLIGLAMMIFRIYDAFLDPYMGNLSDNTRTKLGRRRPFLFIGAVLSGLTFPLIWMIPAGLETYVTLGLFIVAAIIFYTSFTIFVVPWETLSAELTPDYHERTTVVSYRTGAQMLAIGFMGWIYAIINLPIFENTLQGMRWTATGIGLLIIVFGLLPAFFCKERFEKIASKQHKIGFLESIKLSLSNKPFRVVLGLLVLMTLGGHLVMTLGQYLIIYYVFDGAKAKASIVMGYSDTAKTITSVLSLPIALWISKRYGKRRLMYIVLCINFITVISKWFFITPAHPNWQIIIGALLGLGFTPFWVALVAMIGDVADYDEDKNRTRREGSYTAIYTWGFKFSLALTLFLGNVIIEATGFQLSLAGAQSYETFLFMRIALVAVTGICVLGCFWLVKSYPLTSEKAYEIRERLESRRGAV